MNPSYKYMEIVGISLSPYQKDLIDGTGLTFENQYFICCFESYYRMIY